MEDSHRSRARGKGQRYWEEGGERGNELRKWGWGGGRDGENSFQIQSSLGIREGLVLGAPVDTKSRDAQVPHINWHNICI